MASGAKPGERRGGRTKGTPNKATYTKEQARDALRQIVLREMDALAASQIANAKGLSYLVGRDKHGKFTKLTSAQADLALSGESQYVMVEVWEKDPSVQAFTDLMNRALDKPKEQEQELVHSGGLSIRWKGDDEA